MKGRGVTKKKSFKFCRDGICCKQPTRMPKSRVSEVQKFHIFRGKGSHGPPTLLSSKKQFYPTKMQKKPHQIECFIVTEITISTSTIKIRISVALLLMKLLSITGTTTSTTVAVLFVVKKCELRLHTLGRRPNHFKLIELLTIIWHKGSLSRRCYQTLSRHHINKPNK